MIALLKVFVFKMCHFRKEFCKDYPIIMLNVLLKTHKWNRPFPSSPGLCFKTRVGAQPLIWKSFFHSHTNKTHFQKSKGCAPSLILKVRVFGTQKWPIKLYMQ